MSSFNLRLFLLAISLFLISAGIIYVCTRPTSTTISAQHQTDAKTILRQIPGSMAMLIIKVDLPSNSRRVFYRFESDTQLRNMNDKYFNHTPIGSSQPLFIKDTTLNMRIIRLINHEFDCSPFTSTIASKFVPESIGIVSTVCSMSVPPSYGYFTGFITVYLSAPPSESNKDEIRVLLRQFSDNISAELK